MTSLKMPLNYIFCLVAAFAMTCRPMSAAEPLRFDFESGMPPQIQTQDRDGARISPDVAPFGFKDTDSWIGALLPDENRNVAAACAWHIPGEPAADDWMILPEVTIEDDSFTLNWQAKSSDADYPNSYYIAIRTSDSDDFCKVFSVEAEKPDWTTRSVSLSAYTGKKVTVAFVSDSKDKALIFIDDVFIGKPWSANFDLSCAPRVTVGKQWTLEGMLHSDYPAEATDWEISVFDGENELGSFSGHGGIGDGMQTAISIPTSLQLADGESVLLHLYIDAYGERNSEEIEVKGCCRKAVAEEITGTWCAWCVKGIVSMESLRHLYPDHFIGIAAHYNDFLQVEPYASWIYSFAETHGMPNGIVNRDKSYIGSPLDFGKWVNEVMESSPEATVEISSLTNDDGLSVRLDVIPFHDFPNGRLALSLSLVEDDVFDPENPLPYRQHNAYAGGGAGEMGGFENLPEWIDDFHFNDVVRYIEGSPEGEKIDNSMKAGQIYTYDHRLPLSDNILNKDKCRLVVLLIDSRDGSIINADCKNLSEFSNLHRNEIGRDVITGGFWFTLSGTKIAPTDKPGIYIVPTANGYKKKIVKPNDIQEATHGYY